MEICLWPKGDYVLEHLLPQCAPLSDNGLIIDLLHELAPIRANEVIDCDSWYSFCRYLDISWSTASQIFKNCTNISGEPYVAELCVDLLLLSFQPQKSSYSRDELIAEFFHNNMTLILTILLLDPFESISAEKISGLDVVFEGMVDGRPESATRIVRTIWQREMDNGVKALAKKINTCLIPDPFRICNLRGDKSPTSHGFRKKTSLAPSGRRTVSISGWQRLQLLTKPVYRGAHLRIFNSLANPSPIFSLPYCLSAFVENISDCSCLLIGPCSGTVILKNLKNCSITVACRRIFIENLENCTIFLAAAIPPLVVDSKELRFAPYNTTYMGMWEELKSTNNNLPKLSGAFFPEERNESWTVLSPSSFYIQPVPTECEEEDFEQLTNYLPKEYLTAMKRTIHSPSSSEAVGIRSSDISYLKTKVEN